MEITTIAGIILISQATGDLNLDNIKQPACVLNSARPSFQIEKNCNFEIQIIDPNIKKYIENYLKENTINEVQSIEATWTEGIE